MRNWALAAVAALGLAVPAQAELCTYDLTPGAINVNINVAGLANVDLNTTFSGTLVADTTLDGTPYPNTNIDSFELTSASDIAVADVSETVLLGGGLLGSLDIGLVSVGTTFLDGFITDVTTPSNPGPGDFDLGGNTLSLNSGNVSIMGTVLGTAINEALDLSAEPVDFVIPSPVPGTISNDCVAQTSTIIIPISISDTLEVDVGGTLLPVVFTITFNVTGTAPCPNCIPELGSMSLMAVAGLGLVGGVVVRRRRAA